MDYTLIQLADGAKQPFACHLGVVAALKKLDDAPSVFNIFVHTNDKGYPKFILETTVEKFCLAFSRLPEDDQMRFCFMLCDAFKQNDRPVVLEDRHGAKRRILVTIPKFQKEGSITYHMSFC